MDCKFTVEKLTKTTVNVITYKEVEYFENTLITFNNLNIIGEKLVKQTADQQQRKLTEFGSCILF